ncbi:hypothetical protein [Cellvibrio sp. OA-2007]|uniref:hypothetical protein n=1 Tax=Cellvibrio sp. OA-2007 TaxID=529823 RepID=UPI00078486FB|nr:hypothetical protein [Cellvibrio sp. OA-2007]
MKKTQALIVLGLSSVLCACGGGLNQPAPVNPGTPSSAAPSSVAVSSAAPSSVAVSSAAPSSVAVSSAAPSSVAVSSAAPSSVAVSSSSAAALSKVAKIYDANSGDTGELRFVIPGDDQLQGKLTLSFLKDADLVDSNGVEKNAYITLFNSANSTSSGRAILDLLIGSSAFSIRDQAGITVNTPFKPGAWQTIAITWDYAGTAQATVTIVIDGDTANALSYPASSTAVGGVSAVAFRLADNSAVITSSKAFYVDDVKLYSDKAGTTIVYEDNFESYAVGADLSGATIGATALTYDSSTSDVRIAELAK